VCVCVCVCVCFISLAFWTLWKNLGLQDSKNSKTVKYFIPIIDTANEMTTNYFSRVHIVSINRRQGV